MYRRHHKNSRSNLARKLHKPEETPGLYVTALAYVPKRIEGRAPAVICVNGHWPDAKATELIQRRCISSYQAPIGATACVGEVPVNILRYANQWEILGLHAPRPLLCLGASRDVPVFLPKEMYATLERTKQIYRLYGAEEQVRGVEVDSKHDYNREMREILYRHVAEHLLGKKESAITEPDDLPVEKIDTLRVGLPATGETMQSLTFRRAKELAAGYQVPASVSAWKKQRENILSPLKREIFDGFPDPTKCKRTLVRKLTYRGHPAEHWTLEPEPGVIVPAVLVLPDEDQGKSKFPAVLVVDEDGKKSAFERGLVDALLSSGRVVLAIDCRGLGETAGTVPSIEYGPGTPEYNLSNYGLFIGRPIMSMWTFDVRCATDFLAARAEVNPKRISIAGRGRGGLAALLAAAYDDRIRSVATEEMLAMWVFNEEFRDIGLGYFIPRILTVADMPQLIACLAPRPVLIVNPVDGRRRRIFGDEVDGLNSFARSLYDRHQSPDNLQQAEADTPAGWIQQWIRMSD